MTSLLARTRTDTAYYTKLSHHFVNAVVGHDKRRVISGSGSFVHVLTLPCRHDIRSRLHVVGWVFTLLLGGCYEIADYVAFRCGCGGLWS